MCSVSEGQPEITSGIDTDDQSKNLKLSELNATSKADINKDEKSSVKKRKCQR